MTLNRLSVSTALMLAWLSLGVGPNAAFAELIVDPKPPMRWRELLDCERVIVAKYKAHKEKTLSLEVVRVLKGKGLKPGDRVEVRLEHWYSLETGVTGLDWLRGKKQGDGVPKLCYKEQFINPGPLVPAALFPDAPDARQRAVYFLPKSDRPALVRRGQVQSATLADGWQQALDGKPMALFFRLAQPTDPARQREALEELYEKRDPPLLGRLFALLLDPDPTLPGFQAGDVLSALGDREGDIYDRAWKLFRDEARGKNPQRFHQLAKVLARSDPDRALGDFTRILRAGPAGLREVTPYRLGDLRDEKALDLAFNLLHDPATRTGGLAALHTMVGENGWPEAPPAWAGRDLLSAATARARLKDAAARRLPTELASPNLPAEVKAQLRNTFPALLYVPPTVDARAAEKVLLDPEETTWTGLRGGKGDRLLADIRTASDPNLVPLLVKLLREVPRASGSQAYAFRETFDHYAAVCPNRMRRELERQKLLPPFQPRRGGSDNGPVARNRGVLRSPANLDDLYRVATPGWLARQPNREEYLKAACAELDRGLMQKPPEMDLAALQLVLNHDRDRGAGYVRKWLAIAPNKTGSTWVCFLSLAVQAGRVDLTDQLIKAARAGAKPGDGKFGNRECFLFLLMSGQPKALAEYLRLLDGLDKIFPSSLSNDEYLDPYYASVLGSLFPNHPAEFFERVLPLLESRSLAVRKGGVEVLEGALFWDGGFEPRAFAAVRTERLKELRPVLKGLARLPEVELRAALLRRLGVRLDGEAGKKWLPALKTAAVSFDLAAARNALRLIELMVGERGCAELHALAPGARGLALAAWLQDCGVESGPR